MNPLAVAGPSRNHRDRRRSRASRRRSCRTQRANRRRDRVGPIAGERHWRNSTPRSSVRLGFGCGQGRPGSARASPWRRWLSEAAGRGAGRVVTGAREAAGVAPISRFGWRASGARYGSDSPAGAARPRGPRRSPARVDCTARSGAEHQMTTRSRLDRTDRSHQLGPLAIREMASVAQIARDQGRRSARCLLHGHVVIELDAQDIDVSQAVGHALRPAPAVSEVAHSDRPRPSRATDSIRNPNVGPSCRRGIGSTRKPLGTRKGWPS